MRRITRLLVLAGFLGGAVWVNDARLRAGPRHQPIGRVLQRDFRGFVTHRFNPIVLLLGLAGGRRSFWGVVEHIGRSSGRTYHSPVMPFMHDGHVYVRLTYGADVHWVRNIRAAGHCRLQVHELMYELDEPFVVGADAPIVPAWARPMLVNRRYLRLHVLDVAPGTFTHPKETVEEHAIPGTIGIPIVHPEVSAPEDAISAS